MNISRDKWKENASCLKFDTNLFFDNYEEDLEIRPDIDEMCSGCPVARQCFAIGVSQKAWGVWGGIYLEDGEISKEFNRHKTKAHWGKTWQKLTNDN
jgi:hypothetical protein